MDSNRPKFQVGAPISGTRKEVTPTTPAAPQAPKPKRESGARALVKLLQRITQLNDKVAQSIVPFGSHGTQTPDAFAGPMIRRGVWLMVVLFGVIGSWAAFWPLNTGAVALGRVVVDSNRKEIAHLEGGIVKEILVKEGQKVKEGQVLVRMDATNAQARNEQLRGQLFSAKATEARLIAERDKADAVTFPEELLSIEATDAKIAKSIDAQRRLFESRRKNLEGEAKVLKQKILQSREEINGLEKQIASASKQLGYLNEEISVVAQLLKKGNAVRPRLLALQRQAAELEGSRGQSQALISRAKQTINEAKIATLNQQSEFLNAVVAELKETQLQIGTLDEQMRSSSDVVKRIDVIAPIAGQITALKVFTVGGVVQPGSTMMSIVPLDDKLVVDAHINPNDIDIVRAGLKANVKISVVDSRRLKPVEGEVVTVSADRFDDPQRGDSYYVARIEISKAELEALDGFTLTAGMPAEVLIVTGSRTMLSYLTRPIRESFGRAFRQE